MKKVVQGKNSRYATSGFRLFFVLFFSLLSITGLYSCGGDESGSDNVGTPTQIIPATGMDLYGFVGDYEGKPVEGVVVSDGFTCTQTNSKGIYQMARNQKAEFVYYSAPSDFKVRPATFYQTLITSKKRYDFKLTRLSNVETDFSLVCIGDPQVTSNAEITRFTEETMSDINEFVKSSATPVYGLCMGDMAGDKPALESQMKPIISSTNMPVFTTIGNHDKVASTNASEPRNSNVFSSVFGPLNYSFNRGSVHLVCLDDVRYSNSSDYTGGFTDSQVEWLKQDLSYVPKTNMVILYYHIPLRNTTSYQNRDKILKLLEGYAEVHLMCGHTHYTENYTVTSPVSVFEHIHSAACGAWWHSVINGDGTPNGYAVYEISGNKIKNWYYKAVNFDKSYQIRLHKGNASFGGTNGYFTYGQDGNTLMANIWNADDLWTVKVYEDGVLKGNMIKATSITTDAWSKGYHIGVVGRNPDTYSQPTKHLYLYHISNPNAKLRVEAIDRFENKYVQDQIVEDLTTAANYVTK